MYTGEGPDIGLGKSRVHALELTRSSFSHTTHVGKMETDNRTGNFVDDTPAGLANFFKKSMCLKKEEINELDADLHGGDCHEEG